MQQICPASNLVYMQARMGLSVCLSLSLSLSLYLSISLSISIFISIFSNCLFTFKVSCPYSLQRVIYCQCNISSRLYGPLARYVKLRIAHAPEMPGAFFPSPRVSDPGKHPGTCVTHMPWCMPGPLTSDFLWGHCRVKRSRHSRRMHSPQLYVSDKRPMVYHIVMVMTTAKVRTLELYISHSCV